MTRVLVVEDESAVALDIIQQLEQFGYEVAGHASSAKEAIDLSKKEPSPDVILMDINLNGDMDGIEAAEAISVPNGKDIPIIFLTAHSDEMTLQRAKLTRPFGYIIKPYEPNEIKFSIEVALARLNEVPHKAEPAVGSEELHFDSQNNSASGRSELLASLSLFEGISSQSLMEFASRLAESKVEAGEYVVCEGEHSKNAFIVLSGRLALVKSTSAGKALTIDLLAPGDCTSIVSVLENNELDASIRGQIDSRILTVEAAAVINLAAKEPILYKNALKSLSIRNCRTNALALALAHSRVERRVVAALLSLAPRVGKKTDSETEGKIFLTRKELADLTGTTPETAIRTTKHMEREGLLDLRRPGIIKILDINALRQYAADA